MKQLRLNSLENSRRTYARLLRAYFNGEIEQQKFRDLVYGFSTFIGMWKLQQAEELAERIDRIEEALQEQGIRRVV
jgi:hypothetical protein